MKRSFLLLFSFILTFVLCSCRTVTLTSVDELVSRNWYSKSENGMLCTIHFDAGTAAMSLKESTSDEARIISGAVAVDEHSFYITSDKTFKTYKFDYTVYNNRAEIKYGGDPIEFLPYEQSETKP